MGRSPILSAAKSARFPSRSPQAFRCRGDFRREIAPYRRRLRRRKILAIEVVGRLAWEQFPRSHFVQDAVDESYISPRQKQALAAMDEVVGRDCDWWQEPFLGNRLSEGVDIPIVVVATIATLDLGDLACRLKDGHSRAPLLSGSPDAAVLQPSTSAIALSGRIE